MLRNQSNITKRCIVKVWRYFVPPTLTL